MKTKCCLVFAAVFAAIFFGGCAIPTPPPLSPLETRSMQTREYPTGDTHLVMKALLNVLQDEGFTTKNAVPELGLITAVKETDIERNGVAVFAGFLAGPEGVWEKNAAIEATANVSEFGKDTRVRLSFRRKVYSNHGTVMQIEDLRDPQYYQDFFAKVDKGVFLQKERI